MENIKEILKKHGIELNEEQEKAVNEDVKANYRTIADYTKQREKLDLANQELTSNKQAFDEFKKDYEGIDVKELKSKVNTLTQQLTDKDTEYNTNLKRLELKSKVKDKLNQKKCIDIDVALSQMALDDLSKSSNLDTDLETATENLVKTKSYLFAPTDTGHRINVGGSTGDDDDNNSTSTLKDALTEFYDN